MSKLWLGTFRKDFRNLMNEAIIKNARQKFLSDRKHRLKGALNEFEIKVRGLIAGNGNKKRAELRDAYLDLPEDKRQPISLEYYFLSAER